MKFDATFLEDHMSALLGEPCPGTIDFVPHPDLTSPLGSTWWSFTEPIRNRNASLAFVTFPMVIEPYLENVAVALLLSTEHQFSAGLRRPAPVPRRSSVAVAVELVRVTPQQPWTAATLAESSFCSLRCCRPGSGGTSARRQCGINPVGVRALREIPIAHSRKFAESPSQTLRRARS